MYVRQTDTHLTAYFPGQPGQVNVRKIKPLCILIKQETMGWQCHRLDHTQIICTSLHTDNHNSTSLLFTWQMLFLTPNQEYQNTEGNRSTEGDKSVCDRQFKLLIRAYLWSPYVTGQTIIFSSCFFLLSSSSSFFFYSSPNLSGRRLDVYHTFAHGMALVRI